MKSDTVNSYNILQRLILFDKNLAVFPNQMRCKAKRKLRMIGLNPFIHEILTLLICLPMLTVERDCETSDGYIRNHRENVTDNCDHECGWMQCGDVCMKAAAGSLCYCGEKTLDIYRQQGQAEQLDDS